MKVSGLASVLFFLLSITFQLSSAVTTPCALRTAAYGYVCVCNVTYCDYLDPVYPVNEDDFVLTSSSKSGLRFATKNGKFSDGKVVVEDLLKVAEDDMEDLENKMEEFSAQTTDGPISVSINVNRSKKFQQMEGFGGSLTGSVSHILKKIPQELQDAIYLSFYSKQGLDQNLMRMSIGGSDFDLEPWAYNESPENDKDLTNFTKLDPRDHQKIEQLERLKSVTNLEKLKIMASAWSPPRWMKTNNAWTGVSRVKAEYYQTWAEYHLKFVTIMAAKNMPIWAITTGNEPVNGVDYNSKVTFLSLGWTPDQQAIWLVENLGPTIRNSKFSDVLIFSNEDMRYTYPYWFIDMNATRKDSINFLDGLAVHWYWDNNFQPSAMDIAHELMPDKLLLNTESCLINGPELGSWERGEKYAHAYFQDIHHTFNGFIDWNIVLNEQGGPNYVGNFVDAPAIVNVTSGDEFYKQPIFYAIGHFSKFIPEGSIRIEAERSNINIVTAAFERPDGCISVVLFNSGRAAVEATLADSIRGNIVISIPPKSLHTIVYK